MRNEEAKSTANGSEDMPNNPRRKILNAEIEVQSLAKKQASPRKLGSTAKKAGPVMHTVVAALMFPQEEWNHRILSQIGWPLQLP